MIANEEFKQKRQTKVNPLEVKQKPKIKASLNKSEVQSNQIKKSNESISAEHRESATHTRNYLYLSDALISLLFAIAFILIFKTSLTWLERYDVIWSINYLDWRMLVPFFLVVSAGLLIVNSLFNFRLATKGEKI